MARNFTNHEKINIKQKLLDECEKSWAKFGYKKTNIDELCKSVGISKGAFYLFYETKESLFCETLCMVQDRLYTFAEEILLKEPNKYGFAKVLKAIYREYDKCNFIYNTHSIDFVVFTNKLTEDQLKYITEYSQKGGTLFLDKPFINFKVSKEKAISIIYAMLSIISAKEKFSYNHIDIFDFMVDNLIEKIFI